MEPQAVVLMGFDDIVQGVGKVYMAWLVGRLVVGRGVLELGFGFQSPYKVLNGGFQLVLINILKRG
jgi:hypothetical protein